MFLYHFDVSCPIFLIMQFSPDDVQSIVSGKLALRYSGPNVEAMKSIAQASQKRSLANFQKVKMSNLHFLIYFFYSNVPLV